MGISRLLPTSPLTTLSWGSITGSTNSFFSFLIRTSNWRNWRTSGTGLTKKRNGNLMPLKIPGWPASSTASTSHRKRYIPTKSRRWNRSHVFAKFVIKRCKEVTGIYSVENVGMVVTRFIFWSGSRSARVARILAVPAHATDLDLIAFEDCK